MATCGFCKKILTKDDFKTFKKKRELQLRIAGIYFISCPHCDSVLGLYPRRH